MRKTFDIMHHAHGTVFLEYNEDWTCLHFSPGTKVTKSMYRWLKEEMPKLNDFLETIAMPPLMTAINEENDTLKKLASRCGFNYIGKDGPWEVWMFGEKDGN